MNKPKLVMLLGIIVVGGIAVVLWQSPTRTTPAKPSTAHHEMSPEPSSSNAVAEIPAHYEKAPDLATLPPTLSPTQFTNKARDAYQAAREIPQTLAQLPCYCHCDKSLGHKSLHSCFEDGHAASCAVCVDEALLAYRLQREMKLTPEQVRKTIIEKYSSQ